MGLMLHILINLPLLPFQQVRVRVPCLVSNIDPRHLITRHPVALVRRASDSPRASTSLPAPLFHCKDQSSTPLSPSSTPHPVGRG